MAIYHTMLRVPMPQNALFRYLADFSNSASWDPIVTDASVGEPGEIGLNSTFHLNIKTPRGLQPFVFTIIEYDPPQKIVLESITKTYFTRDAIAIRFVTEDESELDYRSTLRLRGFAAIL